MKNKVKASLLVITLISVPTELLAGGILGDLVETINKSAMDAGKSIDKANRDVDRAVAKAASEISRNEVLIAQAAIKEAEEKQKEVEAQLDQLAKLSAQVDSEKQVLEKEKAALESREKLFSMGFYASFTTTLIAIFGLVVKLPNFKIDKKLKLLEIQEKEISIRERISSLEQKSNE